VTVPRDLWPPDVQLIAVDDLEHIGLNAQNELFWDGRHIEVRRPLILT
jgi:hypothetical protein